MIRKQGRLLIVMIGILLAANSAALAEEIGIGVHGGISIPNIRGNQNDPLTRGFSSRQGPFFGIFADFPLSRNFSLVAEFNYTSQGGKRNGLQIITTLPPGLELPPDTSVYADFKNETIIDYVELPVMGRLSFGEKLRFFVNAGPYIGYLVRAKALTSGTSAVFLDEAGTIPVSPPVSFDADTDVMDSLERWNFGLAFGGGLTYPVGPGKLILEAHFQLGLTTIQKDVATSGNSKTGAVVISVGYAFGLKPK